MFPWTLTPLSQGRHWRWAKRGTGHPHKCKNSGGVSALCQTLHLLSSDLCIIKSSLDIWPSCKKRTEVQIKWWIKSEGFKGAKQIKLITLPWTVFFLIDDAVLLLLLLMFCPWLNCQIFWRSLELWDKLKTRGASTSSTTCWREPGRSCAVSTETLFSECNERLHRAKSLCQPCQLHVL